MTVQCSPASQAYYNTILSEVLLDNPDNPPALRSGRRPGEDWAGDTLAGGAEGQRDPGGERESEGRITAHLNLARNH